MPVDWPAEWDRLHAEYGFLPERLMRARCDELGASLGEGLASVLAHPGRWSLQPPGRHRVLVCLGPSCRPKNSAAIRAALEEALALESERTTPDGAISLATVYCCGACGHAPNIVIDDQIHSHATCESAVAQVNALRSDRTPP